MPRRATGSLVYEPANTKTPGHYKARITRADGTRFWFHFPEAAEHTPANDAAFRKRAAKLAGDVRTRNVVAPTKVTPALPGTVTETVREYVARWMTDRERAGLRRQRNERARLDLHVLPLIGDKAMASITSADLKAVVLHLDTKARTEKMSAATATKVWGLVSKLFDDASASKNPSLCILATNPARSPVNVKGPDKGRRRRKQWLYPREASQLLACATVPVSWRRLYAVASYLGLRLGELAALRWCYRARPAMGISACCMMLIA